MPARSLLVHIQDLLGLIYPGQCPVCGGGLVGEEKIMCTGCLFHLPRTEYHKHDEHPLSEVFWGRVNIDKVTALFRFEKDNNYRHLIHQIKYFGQKELGFELGKLLGKELSGTSFETADVIIPVPLHRRKQRKRGFNQSERIASGLASVLEIPVDNKALVRKVANPTQTKKTRYERWENVEGIFALGPSTILTDKHLLLVDDVITTGSTIEACAQLLLSIPGTRVSVAVLAFAV